MSVSGWTVLTERNWFAMPLDLWKDWVEPMGWFLPYIVFRIDVLWLKIMQVRQELQVYIIHTESV